ncbi:MAG: hypothetical protein ACI4M6_01965 [Christensenellaceae bacterium]
MSKAFSSEQTVKSRSLRTLAESFDVVFESEKFGNNYYLRR